MSAVSWSAFAAEAPEVAEGGRRLIYQFGTGLGFIATVRVDGGPRLHPFCPVLFEGSLYGLIAPSPKQRDLFRDSRFAFHTFPSAEADDEFYATGRAVHRPDREEAVRAAFLSQPGTISTSDEACFEFLLERALLAIYKPRAEGNTWPPIYTKWAAGPGSGG
jgi:hypothetical protein